MAVISQDMIVREALKPMNEVHLLVERTKIFIKYITFMVI